MSDPIRVVLHPGLGAGIRDGIDAVEDVLVIVPAADEGVATALADAPVLVTLDWDDDYLVPGLRWVQAISAGTEQFPAGRLADAGVVLTSARGVHGPQVAEHAFGLLLGLTRGIAVAARAQVRHEWRWPPVTEIHGATMGILGLGVIGEAVAERAAAFGMYVIGTKRDPAGYDGAADEVFGAGEVVAVCERSDVVVIALPGGDDTHHLVGAAELAALGPGWLVNVGRGSVVDETALVTALAGGSLRGAGLDVFETEPLPTDSPLWDLPNVIVSPHCAGVSPHYGERLGAIFARNLDAYLGRGPWVNRV
jgi:phosphoglycerate dehydrogenase-like enzyme